MVTSVFLPAKQGAETDGGGWSGGQGEGQGEEPGTGLDRECGVADFGPIHWCQELDYCIYLYPLYYIKHSLRAISRFSIYIQYTI